MRVRFLQILVLSIVMASEIQAQIFIGTISDPDGYTNIRTMQSSTSEILGNIILEEKFEYIPNETNWWWVHTKSNIRGFVHKSRIVKVAAGVLHKGFIYETPYHSIKTEVRNFRNLQVYISHIGSYGNWRGQLEPDKNISSCLVVVRTLGGGREINYRSFDNIDPAGSCAGVSFPNNQPSKKWLFGCKYGGYDGELIQIDSSGKIETFPGGNFFVTSNINWLISPWYSDLSGVTVIDLETGQLLYKKEFEEYYDPWIQIGDQYLAATYGSDDASGDLYIFNIQEGVFKRYGKKIQDYPNPTEVKYIDEYPEKSNCFCNP